MVNRLEALADSIIHFSGWSDPSSTAYQNRNPGLLRAYLSKQLKDESGLRIFHTHLDGYQALLYDLRIKCSGLSHTRLKATSTLLDLIRARKSPSTMADFVAKYLRKALGDETISQDTPLSYFLEK